MSNFTIVLPITRSALYINLQRLSSNWNLKPVGSIRQRQTYLESEVRRLIIKDMSLITKTGTTFNADLIVRCFAIIQITSYQLQTPIYEIDVLEHVLIISGIHQDNQPIMRNMVNIMKNKDPTFIFNGHYTYMLGYLNSIGYV